MTAAGRSNGAQGLRHLRQRRGWSWADEARALRDTARRLHVPGAAEADLASIQRSIARWESATAPVRPGERYRLLLAHIFADDHGRIALGPGTDFDHLMTALADHGIPDHEITELRELVTSMVSDEDIFETSEKGMLSWPSPTIENDPEVSIAQCPGEAEIFSIKSALCCYDSIIRIPNITGSAADPPDLRTIQKNIQYGWLSFQATKYSTLGRILPQFIKVAQRADWMLDGVAGNTAAGLLSSTYRLAAHTLFKLGEPRDGLIAAERALTTAERSSDPIAVMEAARAVAHALTATRNCREAVDLIEIVTNSITPENNASPAYVSVYGMLFLKGAIAAARCQDAPKTMDFLNTAGEIAEQVGSFSNERWTAFSRTNVLIHKVAALADQREGGRVVEEATAINAEDLAALPRERRAQFRLDLARGYMQAGRQDEAVYELSHADQLAPEEVRCRTDTRTLVETLLRNSRGPTSSALVRLSHKVGLSL